MKERIFWLTFVIIMGLAGAFFWMQASRTAEELVRAEVRDAENQTAITSLRERALLYPKTVGVESHLRKSEVLEFKKKGLEEPANDIVADLMKRRDLIPLEGALEWRFVKSDLVILSNKWVIATFEDGHISGRALLEYEVADGGEVSWGMLTYDMGPESR